MELILVVVEIGVENTHLPNHPIESVLLICDSAVTDPNRWSVMYNHENNILSC